MNPNGSNRSVRSNTSIKSMEANGAKGESVAHRRSDAIDILRLIFACIIVVHHARYVIGYDNCPFVGGSLAVEFFFFVSGYLMMGSALKKSEKESGAPAALGTETLQFVRHKLMAILPAFLISWAIGFVFVCAAEGYRGVKIWHVLRDDLFELTLVKMSGIFTGGLNGVMWYISSMLLCMAILYPLIRRFPNVVPRLVMPLTALFLLGYLCRETGHPRNPTAWLGFTYKGNLRAMAELCLGGVSYLVAGRIRKLKFTEFGKWCVRLSTAAAYLMVIRYMYAQKPSETDFFYLFVLLYAVTMTFSGAGAFEKGTTGSMDRMSDSVKSGPGISPQNLLRRLGTFCATYSTSLFFAHLYIAQHLNAVMSPDRFDSAVRFWTYLGLSILNGFVVMGLSHLVTRGKFAKRGILIK